MSQNTFGSNRSINVQAGDQLELVSFVNGQPCPSVDVETFFPHETKQLKAYLLIAGDLEHSIQMADFILGGQFPPEVCQGLFYSSLVSYARCFTDAANGRGVKLDANTKWLGPLPEVKATHEQIMKIRHDFLAHGGTTEFEFIHIHGVLNPDLNSKSVVGISPFVVSAALFDQPVLVQYRELFTSVHAKVAEKIEALTKRLIDRLNSHPIDDLYSKAQIPRVTQQGAGTTPKS